MLVSGAAPAVTGHCDLTCLRNASAGLYTSAVQLDRRVFTLNEAFCQASVVLSRAGAPNQMFKRLKDEEISCKKNLFEANGIFFVRKTTIICLQVHSVFLSPLSPDEYKSKVVCEEERMRLSCKRGMQIAVYSAMFGRTQQGTLECPLHHRRAPSLGETPPNHHRLVHPADSPLEGRCFYWRICA